MNPYMEPVSPTPTWPNTRRCSTCGQFLTRNHQCPVLISAADRFWSKVDRNGPTLVPDLGACWLWTGGTTGPGYGVFWDGHRLTLAPRYVFVLAGQPLDRVERALHRCDNPRCVRPEHLFAGTHQDNMHDAAEKGRTSRGEDRPTHKLTASAVLALRTAHRNGSTISALAHEYSIRPGTVSDVVHRRTWAWLDEVSPTPPKVYEVRVWEGRIWLAAGPTEGIYLRWKSPYGTSIMAAEILMRAVARGQIDRYMVGRADTGTLDSSEPGWRKTLQRFEPAFEAVARRWAIDWAA